MPLKHLERVKGRARPTYGYLFDMTALVDYSLRFYLVGIWVDTYSVTDHHISSSKKWFSLKPVLWTFCNLCNRSTICSWLGCIALTISRSTLNFCNLS